MPRIREALRAFNETVGDRAQMHLAPLVGAAAALVADLFFRSNAQALVLIGLAVTIAVSEARDWTRHRARADCRRSIAGLVRGMLDAPLDLTRGDPLHLGDYLTLRRLAERGRAGAIGMVAGFGGPAYSLAEALDALALSFETEIVRCYGKMRSRDQARVDAFGDALKMAASAPGPMADPPPGTDYKAMESRLTGALSAALIETVAAGDRLSEAFDASAHRFASAAREAADITQKAREWDAAAALYANALEAVQLVHEGGEIPYADPDELARRLREARDIGLRVDSVSYAAATDPVREAHRSITYGDLFDALELLERIRRGEAQTAEMTRVRELVDRTNPDLSRLDSLRR